MPWPQPADYAEAVQNLRTSFRDPDICAGTAALNSSGLPMTWTGNFAAVFKIQDAAGRRAWAAKCFTRDVPGLQERYREIGAHLHRCRLPFMVDFEYLPEGVLVRGQWYPLLKMEWVEGLRLNEFITRCFEEGWDYEDTLSQLCVAWVTVARMLPKAKVGHGDLAHDNVLLVPKAGGAALDLRLIDYDGIYVPPLASRPSGELGHAAYQHPQRMREGGYGPEIDRFSVLLIYCALHCLRFGGKGLWDRFNNGDNLLFGCRDLEQPEQSRVFRELRELPDEDAEAIAGHLVLSLKGRLEDVPTLEQLVTDSGVIGLTTAQQREVESLIPTVTIRPKPASSQPKVPPQPDPLKAETRIAVPHRGRWLAAAAVALLAITLLLWSRLGPGEHQQSHGEPPRSASSSSSVSAVPNRPQQPYEPFSNSIGMKFTPVPVGDFMMGSPDGDGKSDEHPQHLVRITKPFFLGVYEVTQAQYTKVMGSNPSNFKDAGDDAPVEQVSWDAAQEFCRCLSDLSVERTANRIYRLPSEAEWEYACRAGSTSKYGFGDDTQPLHEYAWYEENSDDRTHPVGQKLPNKFGLYDMHGNVAEWCADWKGPYAANAISDPMGPESGFSRVIRGGSWAAGSAGCGSAARNAYRTKTPPSKSCGFRVVCLLPGPVGTPLRGKLFQTLPEI